MYEGTSRMADAIPRTFHRIWFGESIPAQLAHYGRTWERKHPAWESKLWTDDNLPELRNQELFDRASEIAPGREGQFKADIARYEILEREGGVYLDCDFECLWAIDDLLGGVEAFAAWEDDRWVNNAIMGCVPGHEAINELITGLDLSVKEHHGPPNVLSGPHHLTRTWRARDDVTIFPQPWFYPYLYCELDRIGESFPDAYAVHHWHHERMVELGGEHQPAAPTEALTSN